MKKIMSLILISFIAMIVAGCDFESRSVEELAAEEIVAVFECKDIIVERASNNEVYFNIVLKDKSLGKRMKTYALLPKLDRKAKWEYKELINDLEEVSDNLDDIGEWYGEIFVVRIIDEEGNLLFEAFDEEITFDIIEELKNGGIFSL